MQSEARLILRYFGALPKQVGKGAGKASAASTAAAPAAVVAAPAPVVRVSSAIADTASVSTTNASGGASGFRLATTGSPVANKQKLSFAASGL